jgi:hypothetical protein
LRSNSWERMSLLGPCHISCGRYVVRKYQPAMLYASISDTLLCIIVMLVH